MCNVPQIIAEAAADRKRQKLCPIETEASAARTAFGSINNDGVRSSPSERCFCTSDISQLDRHRWHDQPPSSLRRLAATQPYLGTPGDANVVGNLGSRHVSPPFQRQRPGRLPSSPMANSRSGARMRVRAQGSERRTLRSVSDVTGN
jgi:hypothetical protein